LLTKYREFSFGKNFKKYKQRNPNQSENPYFFLATKKLLSLFGKNTVTNSKTTRYFENETKEVMQIFNSIQQHNQVLTLELEE